MLTELEKKIIASIQGNLAVTERPYKGIAEKLGISEEVFLENLKKIRARGLIRRFGATLRHQKSGYASNAMVAWEVEEDRVSRIGPMMAAFKEVTHCYRRNPTARWPYNLYTMVHANSEEACRETARRMARETGEDAYTLLFSRRELKKTSMKYFSAM